MTRAGRRFSASRSAYGNGTTTTSNGSKRVSSEAAISLLVGRVRPLGERGEGIVRFARGRLVEQNSRVGDAIAQRVAGLESEPLAHLARDHGLAFDRDLRKDRRRAGRAVHGPICSLPSYV